MVTGRGEIRNIKKGEGMRIGRKGRQELETGTERTIIVGSKVRKMFVASFVWYKLLILTF